MKTTGPADKHITDAIEKMANALLKKDLAGVRRMPYDRALQAATMHRHAFLRRDGTVWTTDKDGIALTLLAAEITARCGQDPGALYSAPTR